MYSQKPSNFRDSVRSNRGPKRFSSHRSSTGFSRPPQNFSRGYRSNNRRSKLEGMNPNMFIKKSQSINISDSTVITKTFGDFNLATPLKENISSHGYQTPTPIQLEAIDPILSGRDVIGLASTGTGKTAAFLIPLIDKIFRTRSERALIIAPTRELAVQINNELKAFSQNMQIYSALVIGGTNMRRQVNAVRRNPHFLIGTPGRIKDLVEKRVIYLEDYKNIVLDEVDLMVDIGFINDIKYFISKMPKVRQSLFFSATIAPKIQSIVQDFLTNPITISVKKQDTSENVDQDVIRVSNPAKKMEVLHDLLIQKEFNKVLIFGRTKHGVDKLHHELEGRGFKIGTIHGNKSQGNRQRILDSFKQNQIQILVATDVASRGLDIPNVSHVINYELPDTYEDYIHRIGRTGRASQKGIALTFVS